jgi:hypothetical protein
VRQGIIQTQPNQGKVVSSYYQISDDHREVKYVHVGSYSNGIYLKTTHGFVIYVTWVNQKVGVVLDKGASACFYPSKNMANRQDMPILDSISHP